MSHHNTRRDQIAWLVHDNVCGCRGGKRRCTEPDEDHYTAAAAVMPILDEAVAEARADELRLVASALAGYPDWAGTKASVWVSDRADRIARQHAEGGGE